MKRHHAAELDATRPSTRWSLIYVENLGRIMPGIHLWRWWVKTETRTSNIHCLPDTVDPRGPKGK